MIFLRLLKESFIFAFGALKANKVRTLLSLLGITIGIFAIISVFTVIRSLERNIRDSIEDLGDNVVYIQKWPWAFQSDYPWWDYLKRPTPTIQELEYVSKYSNKAEYAAFMVSTMKTVNFNKVSVDNIGILGASHDMQKIRKFEIEKGRYFSNFESRHGKNIAIIGAKLAESLFLDANPIGKQIKIMGNRITVVGVFKKEGEDMLSNSMDNNVLMPINFLRNFIDIKSMNVNPMIMVEAKEGIAQQALIDELRGIMRAIRKLKPIEEDDFALNRSSLITQGFEQVFTIIDIAGMIIGGFSILVGGFGIANIMFVSVKERTKQIGIQKSLGAKNYFILLQFLYEAVVLSIFGGVIGLILVFTGTVIANSTLDFTITMSVGNIITGLLISIIIGVISGFAPARSAAKLNPVDAINYNF